MNPDLLFWALYIAAMSTPFLIVCLVLELYAERRRPDLYDKWVRLTRRRK